MPPSSASLRAASVVTRLGADDDLQVVLADALSDPGLAVTLRTERGWVRLDGAPAPEPVGDLTELRHAGEVVGVVHHGRPPGRDRRLLTALETALGLAAVNARLALALEGAAAEARTARAAVVEASDAARRRVERDLHDGAQQRIVATTLGVQLLRMDVQDPALDAALGRTAETLQAALAELRRLARGLFPAVLTEQGLAAALTTLAEESVVPLRLRAVPDGRCAPEVESAAYFATVAALAGATEGVDASVDRADGTLTVTLDGVRLEPEQLVAAEDRVVAAGGRLAEDRAAGRLVVRLPA